MRYNRSPAVGAVVVAGVVGVVLAITASNAKRGTHSEAAVTPTSSPRSATKSASPLPPVRNTASPVAVPAPGAGLPTQPINRVNATYGMIALTFDDGPDPRWTGQVLALLAQYRIHATFCFVGEYVRKYPALVHQIAAAGHSMCNHTYTHDDRIGTRTPAQIRSDLQATYDAIVSASGGVRPRYFRAPAGRWTPALIAEARAQGMSPLDWTVDPRDWARPGVPTIVHNVLANVRPGSIVLMHDGYGHREQSVAALRLILPELRRRGLHPIAL